MGTTGQRAPVRVSRASRSVTSSVAVGCDAGPCQVFWLMRYLNSRRPSPAQRRCRGLTPRDHGCSDDEGRDAPAIAGTTGNGFGLGWADAGATLLVTWRRPRQLAAHRQSGPEPYRSPSRRACSPEADETALVGRVHNPHHHGRFHLVGGDFCRRCDRPCRAASTHDARHRHGPCSRRRCVPPADIGAGLQQDRGGERNPCGAIRVPCRGRPALSGRRIGPG